MQLYVADYLGDTQHLTTEQHGAYLLLLMTMWRHGGQLPNDEKKLARIARVSPRRWHLLRGDLMDFFTIEGDTITQERLKREHQKAVSISAKRSNSGRLGGHAKALKNKEPPLANATDLPKHSARVSQPHKESTLSNAHVHEHGSHISQDWQPDASNLMEAGAYFDPQRITLEAEKFRDHYRTVPGERGRSRNWSIEWRKWIRRAVDFDANSKRRTSKNEPTPAEKRAEPLREATREFLADNDARGSGVSTEPVAEPFPDPPGEGRLARSGRGLQQIAFAIPEIESAGGD